MNFPQILDLTTIQTVLPNKMLATALPQSSYCWPAAYMLKITKLDNLLLLPLATILYTGAPPYPRIMYPQFQLSMDWGAPLLSFILTLVH